MQHLHNELKHLEQENTEVSSLANVSRELLSPSLLKHKDKGIKSLVACCIADLLRLYAPEAPFTDRQLKVGCVFTAAE
jgi:sister-chromatid-cohesion protein PDS5